MIKLLPGALLIAWLLVCLAGCNRDAPVPVAGNSAAYVILAESADPRSGRLAIDIQVPQPTDENRVKSVAESLINARRSGHREVVIKTYLDSVAGSGIPYAISTLEDGQITHRFNTDAGQQRIPTH